MGGLASRLPGTLTIGVLWLGAAFLYLDGKALAGDAFAIDGAAGAADIESAFDVGLYDVGEAGGGGVRHLSVDDGHALLARCVGTGEDAEPFERGPAEVAGLVVDFIAYFETTAYIDASGGADGELLCREAERK